MSFKRNYGTTKTDGEIYDICETERYINGKYVLNYKMPKKITREINLKQSKGIFAMVRGREKEEYDFENVQSLRNLLSNQRARILDVMKTREPRSIYELAKMLGRPFKSVSDDVKLLQKYGLVEISREKTKERTRHRPKITADVITINVRI